MNKLDYSERVILTDVDGVVLNWEYAFHQWVKRHGLERSVEDEHRFTYDLHVQYQVERPVIKKMIREFNESAAIGFLPPHRDAIHYIRKLHEKHGFVFKAITSLSTDPAAGQLRRENLNKLFGDTVFESVECLDTGADKDGALLPYKDSGYIWVEDKVENAEVGLELGLVPLIMEHAHNMHYEGDCTLVKNWQEIYELVT